MSRRLRDLEDLERKEIAMPRNLKFLKTSKWVREQHFSGEKFLLDYEIEYFISNEISNRPSRQTFYFR